MNKKTKNNSAAESDNDRRLAAYLRNREALLQILYDATATTTTRQLAKKINEACSWYGYAGNLSFTNLGDRTNSLSRCEKDNFIPTPTIAAYLACGVARYAPPPWAKDADEESPRRATVDKALRQVYTYCLCGSLTPGDDCDLLIIDKQPTSVVLPQVAKQHPEPRAKVDRLVADLESATLPTLAECLIAIAENLQERMQRPVDEAETDLPCDENCVMVNYLRFAHLAGDPISDEERNAMAAGTGIPVPRVRRLLCGDPWSPGEAAAIQEWAGETRFTLDGLAIILAAADLNANHNIEAPSAVREP